MDCNTLKVYQSLKRLYREVWLLEDWLRSIGAPGSYLRQEDSDKYHSFLRTTVLALPEGVIPRCDNELLETTPTLMRDLLHTVIERLLKGRSGRKSNVLTFGFGMMSENTSTFIGRNNLELHHLNSNFCELNLPHWQTLLNRVGEKEMMYMLEKTSMFLFLPPGSYTQITGIPVYELPYSQTSQTRKRKATTNMNQVSKKRKLEVTNAQEMPQPYTVSTVASRSRVPDCLEDLSVTKGQNPEITVSPRQGTSCSGDITSPGDKAAKKKTRRGKKKKLLVACTCTRMKNLYDSCKTLQLSWLLYGKDLREKWTLRDRLCQSENMSQDVDGLFFKVFGDHVNSCKNKDPSESVSSQATPVTRVTETSESVSSQATPVTRVTETSESVSSQATPVTRVTETSESVSSQATPVTRVTETFQCHSLKIVHGKLEPILKSFLEKHRSFPYRHFLNHYCPIKKKVVGPKVKTMKDQRSLRISLKAPTYRRRNGKVTESQTYRRKIPRQRETSRLKSLLAQYVPQRKIFLFIRQICLRVLTREIIGGRNWNQLLKRIKELLFMNRFDKVNFRNIMMKIKVGSVPWLQEVANQSDCNIILDSFVWWIFAGYIMVILKTYFYMTDSTMYRNKLFYYRKPVWHQLNTMATKEYLESGILEVLSLNEVKTQLTAGNSLGISRLRFFPKSSSLRPITNMGGNSGAAGLNLPFKVLPINTQLTCVFQVLSYIQSSNPDLVGSSVFGVDDIYRKWKQFVTQKGAKNDNRALYFVSVDIQNCYDSIKQRKLFEIIKDIFHQLGSSEFIIQKFVKMLPSGGEVRRIFTHRVTSLEQFTGNAIKDLANTLKVEKITDAIIVDQISDHQINEDEILQKLSAHIFNNIIRIGTRYYHQKDGISQGSVLSSILCSFYSNHLEKIVVSVKSDELLMRMVDDWLFVTPYPHRAAQFLNTLTQGMYKLVTPYPHRAAQFLNTMTQGLSEYNYFVNTEKTRTNLSGMTRASQTPELFPWCGLVIDTKSLAVSIDYSRYSGLSISHTLSVDTSKHAGETLKRKMLFSIRPRCHPLYVSNQINTEEAVILNVYKIFLLLAFKFNSAVRSLSQGPNINTDFFLRVIVDCAEYFFRQTSQKMRKLDGKTSWSESLTLHSVKWLCLDAFQKKLTVHQAQYHIALKRLRKLLYQLSSKMTLKEKEVISYLDNQAEVLQTDEFSSILN